MKKLTLKMKRTLASLMIWVLVLNNVPMTDWVVTAQDGTATVSDGSVTDGDSVSGGDVSGGDVSGGDVSGGDVSGGNSESEGGVSDGDTDAEISERISLEQVDGTKFTFPADLDTTRFSYEVVEAPENAADMGEYWDLTNCTFPCSFILRETPINSSDNTEGRLIEVEISSIKIEAKLEFNEELKSNLNNGECELFYGATQTLNCSAQIIDDGNTGSDERNITYTVCDVDEDGECVEGESKLAEISTEGIITFYEGMVGTIKVTAAVDGYGDFEGAVAECKIKVVYEPMPNPNILYSDGNSNVGIDEDTTVFDYAGKICAPDGYRIMLSNSFDSVPVGEEELSVQEEGVYEKVFYLRNEATQGITDKITKTIIYDTEAPKLEQVEFSQWYSGKYIGDSNQGYISDEYQLNKGERVINGCIDGSNIMLYYNNDVKISFTIKENNLNIDDVELNIYYAENIDNVVENSVIHAESKDFSWSPVVTDEGELNTAEYTISNGKQGIYYVVLKYSDFKGRELNYRSEYIHIQELKLEFNEALKGNLNNGECTLVYGTTQTLDCSAKIKDDENAGADERSITYTVCDVDEDGECTEGESKLATIESDGTITFKDGMVGTIKVTAAVDGYGYYEGAVAECKIKVDYESMPNPNILYSVGNSSVGIDEDTTVFDYAGKICAPDGYQILLSNLFDSTPAGEEELSVNEEGVYEKIFYLRNKATHGITDKITKTIIYDTAAPVFEKVEFSQWFGAENVNDDGSGKNPVSYIQNGYKLGDENPKNVKLYFANKIDMSFTINERNFSTEEENLNFIVYSKVKNQNRWNEVPKTEENLEIVDDENGMQHTLKYTIEAEGLYYIEIYCKDKAGKELKYRSEYIYVEESLNNKPNVTFTPVPLYGEDKEGNEVKLLNEEGIKNSETLYFDKKFDIEIKDVNNGYFILDSYKDANINETTVSVIEKNTEIKGEGIHKITLFTAGKNIPVKQLVIDETDPVIDITPDRDAVYTESDNANTNEADDQDRDTRLYYDNDVVLTFKITEANLKKDSIKVTKNGEDISSKLTWTESKKEANVWTATYTIEESWEGEHSFVVECQDKVSREGKKTSATFVMDAEKAELAEDGVSYNEWLTSKDVSWDTDYNVDENYEEGKNPEQKLYYGQDMVITLKIHKKNFRQERVIFELADLNEEDANNKTIISDAWVPDENNKDIYFITYKLPENKLGKYQFYLKYMTVDGKEPEFTWTSEIIEMVDVTAPELTEVTFEGWNTAERIDISKEDISNNEVEISPENNAPGAIGTDIRLFAKDSVTVTFVGDEANTDYEKLVLYDADECFTWDDLKRKGYAEYSTDEKTWSIKYMVSKAGDNVIKLAYENENGVDWEEDYVSPYICIDNHSASLESVSCGDWVSAEDADNETEFPPDEEWTIADEKVRIFFNSDATVVFEIKEEYFREADVKIEDKYYKDREAIGWTVEYDKDTQIAKVLYTIPVEDMGNHEITLLYQDRAGNTAINETIASICMDGVKAEITGVDYLKDSIQHAEEAATGTTLNIADAISKDDARLYYNNKDYVKITFTIVEDNLRKDGLTLYNYGSKMDMEPVITGTGNIWNVSYKLSDEAEYDLCLEYKDRGAEDAVTKDSNLILIDRTAAEHVEEDLTYTDKWVSAEDLDNHKVLQKDEDLISNDVRVFYKEDMSVTFVIREKNFRQEDLKISDIHKDGVDDNRLFIISNGIEHRITYNIPVNSTGDHRVTLEYQDKANNEAINYTTKCICMDNTPAKGTTDEITYSQWVTAEKADDTHEKVEGTVIGSTENVRRFYREDMTISFVIKETNFRKDDVVISDTCPNLETNKEVKFVQDSADTWTVTYPILKNEYGEHVVTLEYQDRALNDMVVLESQPIMMDTKAAESTADSVTYSEEKYSQDTADNKVRLYYGADMSVTFEITEENFRAADVTIIDQFLGVDEETWEYIDDIILEWKHEDGKWNATYKIPKEQEGEHIVKLKYQDRSKNDPAIEYETKNIIMDITAPKDSGIKYKDAIYKTSGTTAYFNKDAVISFVITEKNFHPEGIKFTDSFGNKSYTREDKRVSWSQNDKDIWTVTYTIPVKEEGKHNVMLKYTDPSQNEPVVFNTMDIVIDQTVVGFSYELISTAGLQYEDSDKKCFCKDDLTFVFRFQDDNFERDYVTITDTYNDSSTNVQFIWDDTLIEKENEHVAVYDIPATAEGVHIITMNSDDPVEKVHYTSPLIIMDKTNPELMGVTYSDCVVEEGTADSFDEHKQVTVYNNEDVTVTFEIKEANFYADDVRLNDSYNNTTGIKLEWKQRETDGIWFAAYTIPKGQEGKHVLDLYYQDRSKNKELTYVSKTIVIDTIAAKLESVGYSKCTDTDEETSGNSIIRYYSNNVECESGDVVEVTFKVIEKYFHEAGVSVTLSKDGEKIPQDNWSLTALGNDEYEITCFIPKSEEGDYVITFSYQDRCKNGEAINVVSDTIRIDNQAAIYNVTYSEFVSARKAGNGVAIALYQPGNNQDVNLFYNQDVILTFEITEKHFYPGDVEFADNFDTSINKSILQWKPVEGKTDVWMATYKIPNTAEGKHNITLNYQDRSKNTPAINYASENIIVDKTAAVLSNVTFGGNFNYAEDVSNDSMKLEGYQPASREDVILYYNKDMSITFEITEANFYKDDVVLRDSFYTDDHDIALNWEWNAAKAAWVATYPISVKDEGVHRVTLKYYDRTENEPYIYYTSEKIVMDKTASKLTDLQYSKWSMAENSQKDILKDYNAGEDFDNVRLFYCEDMVITFEITENYFQAKDVHFRDAYHSAEEDIILKWQQGTGAKSNVWTATYTIPKTEEGEHLLALTYGDRSANEQIMYTSERIIMDITAPKLSGVAFSTWKQAVEADGFKTLKDYAVRQLENVNLYYDDTMTMKFEITEVYFNPEDVTFKDNGNVQSLKWNQGTGGDSDKWVAEYTIPESAVGEHLITLSYQDRSLNEELIYVSEKVVMDTDAPVIHLSYIEGLAPHSVVKNVYYYGKDQQAKIYIKENNFRAADVVITIDTTDAVGVVDVAAIREYLNTPTNWTKAEEGYVAYVTLDTDARYDISIMYKDLALREAQKVESSIVVDNQKPVEYLLGTDITYDTENCKRMVDENNRTVTIADADTRFIYQDAMTFKFAMKEINFDAKEVLITVLRDKEKLNEGSGYSYAWNKNWSSDKETYIHTLTMELGRDGQVVVDGNYQVVIEYTDRAGHALERYTSNIITIDNTNPEILIEFDNNEASEYSYSNADKSEPYYYNKDRVATITITDRNVVAEEIELKVIGKDITGVEVPFDLKTKQTPWEFDEETNHWTSQIAFDEDAYYELEILIDDMATNSDTDFKKFTVDKTAPDKESFKVIYSDTVKNDKESDSNNAFYKDIVTVKISIEDVTSRIYGFKMTYRKQKDASSINKEEEIQSINYLDKDFEYAEDKRTATAIFRLTTEEARQYRGNLYFEAIDMAGNHSEEISDTEKIVIVDNISPTRTVEYSAASQIVNKESLNTINGFDYATENAPVILLYNSPMEITFKINEANFYEEDIILEVNKKSAKVSSWKKEGDLRIGKLKIVEDGEYTVTLQYTDRSTNKMVDYTSHTIIVDTAKPQIYVSYSPDDVKQQIDGIKYYDKQQTATITIKERNFRASDVEVVFSARDINGNSVGVPDYDSILKNKDSWSKVDDNHVAKITFAIDANYEFDIMYKDLALISSDDYMKDVFTVDQTAPTNVSVNYSVPVFEKTLQGTDYKYYNEPVVVTLVAEDETSPIHSFDYSYMRAEGVSTVNAEGIANRIDASKITYSNGRKTATATFVLPASELRAGTQINGGLEYAATNRASLTTELKDMKRYVVDSIAPTVNVEFSDCVKQANNISYYAGNIDVTINIEEANFFSEDVKVRISKDGGEQTLVDVSWRTLSVDRHVGTFKLEEEGDYKVYISYQDSSTNKMTDYQSNQLTIDRTKPSVTVSGIRHNSANKKSQIGYVVKVEDVNLDANTFDPKLIAEIRNEAGNIEQIDCTDIGTVDVVVEGKSCTYTITNIKYDGIYHFESSVSDMSGNTTNEMVIEGIVDKMVSVLEYSVNRNGSTYGLEESTKGLNNRFVKEARDVIIYETNPDEITNIVITLFKNDKSIVLVEGKDYVVNKISKAGEWFKYEYIIYATNFMQDGTYHISIYSEDKAGNIAENNLDVKNVEINFGVDKTLPKVIVTNLESKQTYPVDKLSVLMQATDNMKLVNIMVELDGKLIASWNEEQIIQMGADLQDFVFDIIGDSTQAHTVTITLTDVAGNQCIETISDFYVTTNLWVQFVNNKLLFYGSIAAVIGGGIGFIPLWRRRRRRREARG